VIRATSKCINQRRAFKIFVLGRLIVFKETTFFFWVFWAQLKLLGPYAENRYL